ncbi:MAG: PAS domain S-box protein, partial [Candidatus Thermoplasmatota archaeon]|nr:PAS domain S-box protein [Candidatus Thermoplasmatota archaeon]
MVGDNIKNNSPSIVEEMQNLEKNGFLSLKSKRNKFNEQLILNDYTTIFDKIHEGIFLLEENSGIIKYVNKKAADLIGLKKEEIIGKPENYFINPINQKNHFTYQNKNDESETFSLIAADGKKITISKDSSQFHLKNKSY